MAYDFGGLEISKTNKIKHYSVFRTLLLLNHLEDEEL